MLEYGFTYGDLEYFLLIFIRVASFVFIAPFFSMSNTPKNVRVALSFFVAFLLYQSMPRQEVVYDSLIGYTIVILKEVITGLLIGFAANLCSTIVAFAGQIASMEMGLSMASMMDPTTRENTTVTGVYYNYIILLLLMSSGMHRYFLKALAETYILIPVNGAVLPADFCRYDYFECGAWRSREGISAAEHVCGRYADEGAGGACNFACNRFHAAGCSQFYL